VLYETITGQMPWDRPNYNALMQAIIHEPPAATTELSAGDADLWRVIERGLEKKPENRWASMTELGEALALWLYEHGVKEDISANSLRAVWLDGSLSGVRMELGSVSPHKAAASVGTDTSRQLATGPRRAVTSRPAQRVVSSPSAVQTERPRRANRWLLPGLVGAALGLGLGVGALVRGSHAEGLSALPVPAPTAVAPSASALTQTAAVTPSQISAPRPTEPLLSAKHPAVNTPPHSTPSSSPVRTAPASRAPKSGKKYDFGF